jgi:3-methylcrotonyl-CoA carboxylase beta subunit
VIIVANDATVKGGTYFPLTMRKHLRAQEIAMQNALPCIYLVDSGGIFLPMQDEVFPDADDFGQIFYNQARMSARACPDRGGDGFLHGRRRLCSGHERRNHHRARHRHHLFGGSAAGQGCYRRGGFGRRAGRRRRAYALSGVADHFAENDDHALEICRSIIETLPVSRLEAGPILVGCPGCEPARRSALPDAEEIYGILPTTIRETYDVREIIARLVDASEFREFKARYGDTLVTGFARIHGYPVGILGNNGVLFSESA